MFRILGEYVMFGKRSNGSANRLSKNEHSLIDQQEHKNDRRMKYLKVRNPRHMAYIKVSYPL